MRLSRTLLRHSTLVHSPHSLRHGGATAAFRGVGYVHIKHVRWASDDVSLLLEVIAEGGGVDFRDPRDRSTFSL